MEHTLACVTAAIADILADKPPTIYLYGSCALGDFRPGWSDIDLLALTPRPLTDTEAQRLLTLRQDLPAKYPETLHIRACEGCIAPLDSFTNPTPSSVVYWGTTGQRLTDRPSLDAFALWQLQHQSKLLHGPDVRHFLPKPTAADLHAAVGKHLRTILDHGCGGRSIYAFGWLLDIARCLYTLRHDSVVAKTAAGEWALNHGLCPDAAALRMALDVRRDPALMQQLAVLKAAESLTPAIAAFAAVLQQELAMRSAPIP